ncbi:acid protease [Aureobasidium namibiae CBS 147.97]|uniref:Acid protease n=1 Tax=Aureobasidium namibiae CBS 147.97 TaxID=1043004 RepID=A0A074WMU3_9PEZI|nr:acid protease [Aureobasidium namibiae CBS 147.97]KEQ71062.1 acid protease [Aureobasidium namibiae CBS 147.97]
MSTVGDLDNLQYYVNFTVGTPGQPQLVFVDTGSSNTFVLASNASFCKVSDCDGVTFDLSKSSTYEMIKRGRFQQLFMGTKTWFTGDYVRDVVQMNDLVISKLPFGLARQFGIIWTPHTGVMGLGYSRHMSIDHDKKLPPSFLEGLVQAGAISSRLYSIYLNTLDQYGSILFGGLDTDKYKGSLTTLNLVRRSRKVKKVDDFHLYLEEVKMQPFNQPSQTILRSTNDSKIITLIDTGTPDWRLPRDAFVQVVRHAGGKLSSDKHEVIRPCSEVARGMADTTYFDLTFAGNGSNTATLRLELADLFSPVPTKDGSVATDDAGRPMCELRVVEAVSDQFLLTSSSVMRAGYFVFDLDNGQVSLAQANLGANSSNVVRVEAGPQGLKKAAKNLIAETQRDEVEGLKQVSMAYELSTATNTVGYATGIKSYSAPTGTGAREPLKVHNSSRGRADPRVRRAENAAAITMSFGANVFWALCAAVLVAVGIIAV